MQTHYQHFTISGLNDFWKANFMFSDEFLFLAELGLKKMELYKACLKIVDSFL